MRINEDRGLMRIGEQSRSYMSISSRLIDGISIVAGYISVTLVPLAPLIVERGVSMTVKNDNHEILIHLGNIRRYVVIDIVTSCDQKSQPVVGTCSSITFSVPF